MSFGIDQAITALTITFDICMKVKNAPGEVEEVKKATTRAKTSLHILKTRMADPKSPFSKADARIKSLLTESTKEIQGGVKKVEAIINERLGIPWWEFGSYTSWVLIRVPKLKLVAQGFDVSESHIQEVIQYIQTDAIQKVGEDIGKEGKNAAKRAKQQEDKLRKIEKQAADATAALKRSQADVAKLLALAEKNHKLLADAAVHGGEKNKEIWIEELVKEGMAREEANSRLGEAFKTVKSEHDRITTQPPKATSTVKKPKPRPNEAKAAPAQSSKDDMKDAKSTKPPTTGKESNPQPNSKTAAKRKPVSILIVDANNGERSIITQTYLELIRSWTMNTEKKWLFDRIDSVGRNIPTKFSKEHIGIKDASKLPDSGVPASKDAISAVAGEESFFWSKNPNEKEIILERMQKHKSAGIGEHHFSKFHYILCFNQSSQKWLEKMKEIATENAKNPSANKKAPKIISTIHYLKGCELFGAESNKTLQKACGQIKVITKAFLRAELGWERPQMGMSRGQWRTLQFVVTKDVWKRVSENNSAVKKNADKDWEVHTCPEYMDKTVLVSISGPREKLEGARKSIMDA